MYHRTSVWYSSIVVIVLHGIGLFMIVQLKMNLQYKVACNIMVMVEMQLLEAWSLELNSCT